MESKPNDVRVIDGIPVKLDPEEVLERLKFRRWSKRIEQVVWELTQEVVARARPKVLYKIARVGARNGDMVEIDGIWFESRILRINLDRTENVFPFILTCGEEIDSIRVPTNAFTREYILNIIKDMVLADVVGQVQDLLSRHYALGPIWHMLPGDREFWALAQQKELFSVLGNMEGLIGVRLTEHDLLLPVKSISGICFPTTLKIEYCQLCPRQNCISRKAPYDPDLVKRFREENYKTSGETNYS